ncbi:MAG: hypothetical protein H6744_13890 [Deltaproteobacteria bacterium]|nr:hypothetical protein [Deltaproteobacteria bacterium]MCB9787769.1 hypothetical protein [Deltaproteobacteria bacterium]
MHLAQRLSACLIPAMGAALLLQTACSSCQKEEAAADEVATAAEGEEEADAARSGVHSDTVGTAAPEPKAEGAEAEAEAKVAGDEEAADEATTRGAERARAAGAAEPSVDSLDPEEQRRIDRERRIAELKRRNEERRKELVARAAAAAEGAETPEGAEAAAPQAPEAAAPEAAAEATPEEAAQAPAPAAAEAPAEVPAAHQPTAGPVGLDISRFLNVNDVRRITGDRTLTPNGTLSGIPPSETYGSMYFAPPVRANFGVSLQVWIERTRRDANDRFRRMRRDYTNAEDTTVVGPKGFFSYWNDILTISFSDLTKRVVVSVSCNASICRPDQLIALANAVRERL